MTLTYKLQEDLHIAVCNPRFEPRYVYLGRAARHFTVANIKARAMPRALDLVSDQIARLIAMVKGQHVAIVSTEVFYRVNIAADIKYRNPAIVDAKDIALPRRQLSVSTKVSPILPSSLQSFSTDAHCSLPALP